MRKPFKDTGPATLVVALVLPCFIPAASAYEFREHDFLGRESYQRACITLGAELNRKPPADRGVHDRYALACAMDGPGLDQFLYAVLYGEACQFAGDHFLTPDEFTSDLAGRNAGSIGQFLGQAIQNRKHFHPDSVRTWMEHHRKALELAEAAARNKGLAQLQSFQQAFFNQAFADHFLHDSFAAGHLGFNRAASSNAPARDMHNFWNRRGRTVEDREGNRWNTYGDGMLQTEDHYGLLKAWAKKAPEQVEDWKTVGRPRLEDAAAASVAGFLHAFVMGERLPQGEQDVWRRFPIKAEMPTLGVPSFQELLRDRRSASQTGDALGNLAEILRPAEVSMAYETWSFFDGTAKSGEGPNSGMIFGAIAEYPISYDLWGGVKSFRLRIYSGLGRANLDGKGTTTISDFGYVIPMFFTNDGLFTHELVLGVTASKEVAAFHPDYRLSIELGKLYLRLQAGPSWRARGRTDGERGYYASLGAGWVLSSRGGGPRSR